MEKLSNLSEANAKVLKDIQNYIEQIRNLVLKNINNISDGIVTLRALRAESYEDLNQIQHEEMILRAIDYLQKHASGLDGVEWGWNPRQTGSGDEPDLRGIKNGTIVLSAEITTSEKPEGTIGKRMQTTLAKLSKMAGVKYYFVRTAAMAQRARTKVSRRSYEINVKII